MDRKKRAQLKRRLMVVSKAAAFEVGFRLLSGYKVIQPTDGSKPFIREPGGTLPIEGRILAQTETLEEAEAALDKAELAWWRA